MLKPDRQSVSNLRLVASSDRPAQARPQRAAALVALVVDERPRRQLLRTMALVATARRFAAARLRHKLMVGRAATLWLTAVTAWTIALPATSQGIAAAGLLALIGILLLFRPAMDERLAAAAVALDRCAADIDALASELDRADARDSRRVHEMRDRYGAVVKACGAKHLYADYMAARQAIDGSASTSQARAQYVATTYAMAVALALLPILAVFVK